MNSKDYHFPSIVFVLYSSKPLNVLLCSFRLFEQSSDTLGDLSNYNIRTFVLSSAVSTSLSVTVTFLEPKLKVLLFLLMLLLYQMCKLINNNGLIRFNMKNRMFVHLFLLFMLCFCDDFVWRWRYIIRVCVLPDPAIFRRKNAHNLTQKWRI